MLKLTLIVTTFATASVIATSAFAGPPQLDRTSEKVALRDIDLSTVDGARAMLSKIEGAAARLCAPGHTAAQPRGVSEARRCRSQAIAAAVATLGNPRVSAEYARRSAADVAVAAR